MTTADSLDHDFDGFWKEALDEFLVDFLQLLAPDVLALLDVSQPIVSLDKELQALFPETRAGKRFVDKLFKIALRAGGSAELLFHIEAQGDPEPAFAERMFVYRYRIFDRHRMPLYFIAILADDDPNWRPDRFERRFHDDVMLFKFRTIKLLDLRPHLEDLEASSNPFALLVAAYLRTRETRPDRIRLQWKVAFVRRIFTMIEDRARARRLLRLVNWLMRLPDDLAAEFRKMVTSMNEHSPIPEMMDFEIEWMQKGEERGRIEGKAEGKAEGLRIAKQQSIVRVLRVRFGGAADRVGGAIGSITDPSRLDHLVELAAVAKSLEEFEAALTR